MVRSPLIDAEDLARLLRADGPTLLDVRWELGAGPRRDQYEAAHIPGARFLDLDAELAAPPGPGGRHPLPSAADFQEAMRAAGVDDSRAVVCYDAATSTAAARAWWLLRYFGHPDVAVLDGGLAEWRRVGNPVQAGPEPGPASGSFTALPGGMPVLDAAGAQALARRGVLLDARAPERYAGEREPIDPVAGHIPGARNRPTTHNLREDGRFKAPDTLRRELPAEEGMEVGVYCGSGVTAAHEVLALEVAGRRAALYPGSWSEWIVDPGRPVATGYDDSYK